MTGAGEIGRATLRVDRYLNGARPIGCRDTGGNADGSLDRDGEVGTEARAILLNHKREVEPVGDGLIEGEADQPPSLSRHKRNRLWGGKLRSADEITLILTLFIINHNHYATCSIVAYGLFNSRADHRTSDR